jgi:gas vesicle protein
MPNSPDELAEVQRILDHIDENQELYPLLSKLQEYEVFGALGHDPQTAREVLAQNCQVETEYVDDKTGMVVKRDEDEIRAEIAQKVDAILAEAETLKRNVKYLPRRSVYVDLPRTVDATQLRVASQILKRYRAEIENLFRARYGGAQDSLWKGLLIGGGIGAAAGAIGLKLLGGG